MVIDQLSPVNDSAKFWGFSISCLDDVLPTLYAVLALKTLDKTAVVIIGGAYLKYLNKELIIDNPNLIDFLVVGDGEYALTEILINNGDKDKLIATDNLVFYKDGKLIINPVKYINFNDIKLPDYEIVKADEEIYYNFSRGCGGQCMFCTSKDKLQFKNYTTICSELDLFNF